MAIRAPRADELPRLQEIERAGGELFTAIGMDDVGDDPPFSLEELEPFRAGGRALVATDDADVPVAYLVWLVLDGAGHIEQVTVHPGHARQGLGAQLIERLAAEHPVLTLTTYRDIPWNGPYYRRLGFRELDAAEYGPDLAHKVAEEAGEIPGEAPRIAMRRGA